MTAHTAIRTDLELARGMAAFVFGFVKNIMAIIVAFKLPKRVLKIMEACHWSLYGKKPSKKFLRKFATQWALDQTYEGCEGCQIDTIEKYLKEFS